MSESLLPAFEQYLPDNKLSISSLLAFKLPPSAPAAPSLVRPKIFVSELAPNSEDVHEITSLQIPPPNILSALQDLIENPMVKSIQWLLRLQMIKAIVSDCQGFENPCGFWVGYAGVGVRVSFFNPWQTHTPGRGLRVYPSTISHGFFLPVQAWT